MSDDKNVLSVDLKKGARILPKKSVEQRIADLEIKQAELEAMMSGSKAKK